MKSAYAIELINTDDIHSQTIEALAAKSGFAAHSTFIRAFKNKTSKTPSEYIKHFKQMGE